MNYSKIFKIGSQIPEKNPLKGINNVVNHCYHLGGMGVPLVTHSSQTKNDRNLWFVLLHRIENVDYESSITF